MPTAAAPSATLEDLLRLASSAVAWRQIGPDLSVTTCAPHAPPSSPLAAADAACHHWLEREGFSSLGPIAEPFVCTALVRAIQELRARGLPASFVYAFDEAWAIGQALRHRISAIVGHDYRLVEDVWAWHILPGAGRGWPAHRGVASERFDRQAPEVINVWVALSNATPERACIHAIPLDQDPGYPDALDRLDASLESVRALPAAAGDALLWNANVLHWGGPCSARAIGPRVSCSFTLCRADAARRLPGLTMLAPLARLDLAARMDVLARMVLVYGQDQSDVSDVVREWAALTHALTRRFSASEGQTEDT